MRRLLWSLSLCVVILALGAPAYAQIGFGSSVALNGDEVVAGEPGNMAAPGYVYIYRRENGEWIEAGSLTAPDAREGDGFGTAVLADGDTMLISAVTEEGAQIYVYGRESGAWKQTGTLRPAGDEDAAGFGGTMARHGDWLLVGATRAEEGWGASYLFRLRDGEWRQVGRWVGERGEIATHDQTMALMAEGAPADMSGPPGSPQGPPGAEEQGPPGAQEQGPPGAQEQGPPGAQDQGPPGAQAPAEDLPDPTPERFGAAVAISEDWAFVGAPESFQHAGRVYVFHRDGDEWERVASYDYSVPGDRFGASLALNDDLLAIGAPQYAPLGAVRRFVFDDESGEWVRIGSAFSFEGAGYLFGASIQIADGDLYIASINHVANGGMIYRYRMDEDYDFTGVEKIGVAGFSQGDALGAAFAMAGDTMVLGAPGDDAGAGSVVIMDRSFAGWNGSRFISDYKGLDPITGRTVACSGGMADRFACDNVDLLAFLPLSAIGGGRGTMANDIWGWTDPQSGHDYALVGLSNGTSFVDVTDGNNPVYVGRLPKTAGAPDSVWRDIKIDEGFAYIVSDAAPGHGVQIFDLSHLRDYSGEPIEFAEDAHYDGISSAHNIVVNEDSDFAYAVGANGGGETCGGGLHMINIEDPHHPTFAGCFADITTGMQGTGYSHDAQCVIYHGPDQRYSGHEICVGSNETAISIADVTDKRNPVALGTATYPKVGYTHQGWFTDDQRYFYQDDELDEISGLVPGTRTMIWDVEELDDPILAGEYVSDNPSVDHNLYIKGNLMFQSNYDSGLRVLDITDRQHPRPIAWFDTVPWHPDGGGMTGSWSNFPYFDSGNVVVTSMNEGVFVLKPNVSDGRR